MKSDKQIATITLNPAIDQTVTIPNFTIDSVNRVSASRCDAGGKGVNVAAFLADHGLPVTVTGFLGKDNLHLFERFFAQKKIADQFVRIAGSTRTGIKIIDDVNQGTTDINFPGQTPTEADLQQLYDVIDRLALQCAWFVIAGSIPIGVPADIYRVITQAIVNRGGQVALDSSGEGFRQALKAKPSLAKPNIHELAEICGKSLKTQAEIIESARQILDQGLQTVVVSMGEKGALFVEKDTIIRAVPPRVPIKSTVGAGDAMLSGMVAGKIKGRSLEDCARLATAFSVIAVTHIGAGLPQEVSLRSIESKIEIKVVQG